LPCYRCGEPGHFVVECTTELCDYCCRSQHKSGDCPLLSGPKPVVTIYGVCCQELMFFESPDVAPSMHVQESSFPVVVKVTN
uniref:CCHC-type domain-containing protein n=1 Tax=Aegilops tauschii subsp. strangulata TaxID=200361 RepID=A0A453I5Y4_AEGTS